MKQNRRLLSVLVAICLIAGLVPMTAFAANSTYGPAVIAGSSINKFDTVHFADNDWIVLDSDENIVGDAGMVLLSKDVIGDTFAYQKSGKAATWAGSDAKVWCAQYLGERTAGEKSVMQSITKAADAQEYFATVWSADALEEETVFFLSTAEVSDYFGDSALTGTEFVTDTGWWLRSVDSGRDIMAGAVSDAGFVGAPHVATNYAARPAVNIMTPAFATVGEKASSLAEVAVLTAAPAWNLTFLDTQLPAATVAQSASTNGKIVIARDYASASVTVEVGSAVAGDKIGTMIVSQLGDVLYYGQVQTVSEGQTSYEVVLPAGLVGQYTVKVFTERTVQGVDFAGSAAEYTLFVDDGLGRVAAWNINLNDNISAKFYMDIPESVSTDEGAYIAFAVNGYVVKKTFDGSFTTDGRTENAVPIQLDLAAAQMTDVITVTIVDGEGNQSAGFEYSIRAYADKLLSGEYDSTFAKDPDVTKALVKAMLNYGGKAQLHFGYNTENLANKGIEIEELPVANNNYAAIIEGSAEGIAFAGASLVHDSRTAVRFYFTITDGATHTTSAGALIPKGNMHYVEIDGINPDQLEELVSVTVDNGLTIRYSPMYYIERMFNRSTTKDTLKAVLSAMNSYWNAAEAYVNANGAQ